MYEIDRKSLLFKGGKRCRFAADIAEVLTCDDAIIIRLTDDPVSVLQNVYSVDFQGNILWQIPPPRSFTPFKPYVRVTFHNGQVDALNWDGHVMTLHPRTGMILSENYGSYEDPPATRRVPQPRRWI